jgi:hypothetical protein
VRGSPAGVIAMDDSVGWEGEAPSACTIHHLRASSHHGQIGLLLFHRWGGGERGWIRTNPYK